ncbi:MAG: phosphoribosylanthranilate isomerase [Lachnospiraceae bacterium]|nr:phosphoribosylanthranilate isomerase [Lachnospiraceae bacterium]
MTGIKICGITTTEEASWLVEEKAEYAGMVLFCENSKRMVRVESAYGILRVLKSAGSEKSPKAVAVTVSPTIEQIAIIQKLGFDYIQVHGKLIKEAFDMIQIPIIRAINGDNLKALYTFLECPKVAAVLFDAPEYGSGKTFDWGLLDSHLEQIRKSDKLFILAGGLNAENVGEAIKRVQPDIVDVSSGVEKTKDEAGKDRVKINEFIRKVRTNE